MAKRDFYDVLGVAKSASDDEIKKAYRKLAMQYHPDRNPGDKAAEAKFKEATEAYEVLKDKQKKAAYDQFGHGAFDRNGGFGGVGGFGNQQGFHNFHQGRGSSGAGFSDIFEEIFGDFMGDQRSHRARQPQAQKGADLQYDLDITLEQAFTGVQKVIHINTSVKCEDCNGSGAAKNSGVTTCSDCGGSGVQRVQQGFFTIERTCGRCQGTGQLIKDPCKSCYGQGRVTKPRQLKVSIPAGVEDGTRIRLSGEGQAGLHGAPAGDLYVFITVHPHRLFQRTGPDLLLKTTIPMTTAILGGEIEVPTIEGGKSKVKVPAGTPSGKQFRLRGKGMSIMRRSERGDMYIQLEIETPVNLTDKQRELIQEFEKISQTHNNSPHTSSFLQKLKDFWHSFKS
jgi:chaperone protein DnaJ